MSTIRITTIALFLAVCAFFALLTPFSFAAAASQTIELEPGWNVVSTPKVLESHAFSAPETADNFDIYVLDAESPTGWSTLADLNQTEFAPLYGYFINNKTGVTQTLTFNYATGLEPNEKFFERSFPATGWYSIGVANDEYAKDQNADRSDTNNPSNILSLLAGDHNLVIDFTDAQYDENRMSVALEDPWKAALPSDINELNDFRETKAYAVYITEAGALYNGFQNDAVDEPIVAALNIVESPNNPEATVLELLDDEDSDAYTVFAFGLSAEESTEDILLTGINVNAEATTAITNYVSEATLVRDGNAIATASSVTADTIAFVFDAELIEAGELADFELRIAFQPLEESEIGHTIEFSITPAGVEASAGSEITLNGSASSKGHTLQLDLPVVSNTNFQVDRNEAGDAGVISFEFTIQADDTDLEFKFEDTENVDGSSDDVRFTITGTDTTIAQVYVTRVAGDATNLGGNNGWLIAEGDEATFVFDANFQTQDVGDNGTYRVTIDTIAGVAIDETSSGLNLVD